MKGIVAAVPTPIDNAGVPQRAPFVEHCQWALSNGCDGLNVLGSTGEAASTDFASRKTITQWAAEAVDPARLMVGTGTPSLAETIALTTHADDLGYAVALVLPPFYYKPATEEGLFAWYEALHQALGARRIALYFYNFPAMTGITLSPGLIARLCAAYPTRFRGIKDSSGDLDYCRKLVADVPDLAVFPSSETALSEAAEYGFAGCISATVNHSSPLCGRIWAARDNPDAALMSEAGDLRQRISAQSLIPSVKYMVARRTGNPVWTNVLPPFTALSDARKAALDSIETTLSPALVD